MKTNPYNYLTNTKLWTKWEQDQLIKIRWDRKKGLTTNAGDKVTRANKMKEIIKQLNEETHEIKKRT